MPLLRLLGTPHLDTDSGRLDLLPQRPALLLWRLALEGDWLTREYLADLFWPEGRDGDARHNLRLLIARARKVPWAAGLECEPTRLRWVTDSDTERFRRAVSAGAWADALRWYRQPLLSGLPTLNLPQYESWLEGERYGLHAAWREAVRQRAEQAQGDSPGEAARLLLDLWHSDPLAEDVLLAYLRAALEAGHRELGLQAYERFAELLNREVGMRPTEATCTLAEHLRSATPAIPPQVVHSVPAPVLRAQPLIGRAGELARLQDARLAVVGGEPGIGKTRLLTQAAPDARWLRASEGLEGVPYHPVLEHLRACGDLLEIGPYREDLARLLPDLVPIRPPALDPATQKVRVLEALARTLEARAEVLVADDLQWADAATLELLIYLARRGRLRLLLAYRTGEVGAELERVLGALPGLGALRLQLEPLGENDLRALLGELAGQSPGPLIFSTWLHARCGGNPLFALEILRAMFEDGTLWSDAEGWHTPVDNNTLDYGEFQLPPRVKDVVVRRLQRLPPDARRTAEVLSVARDHVTPALIAAVTRLSPWAVVEALEEAGRAGLVEQGRFSHDLLRQSVYAALPAERRALLHGEVGRHLIGAAPAVLAEHFMEAGDPSTAAAHLLAAGNNAFDAGLIPQALAWLRRAVEAATPGAAVHLAARLRLGEVLIWEDVSHGRTLLESVLGTLADCPDMASRGARVRALAALSEHALYAGELSEAQRLAGLALVVSEDDVPPAIRHQALTSAIDVALRAGRLDEAAQHVASGQRLLPDDPVLASYEAQLAYYQGDLPRSRHLFERLIDQAPSWVRQLTLEHDLGRVLYDLGELDAATIWLRRSLQTFEGVAHAETLTRATLGLTLTVQGRFREAWTELRRGETLARQHGLGTFLAEILFRQANMYFSSGDLPEAARLCREALSQIRAIGDPMRLGFILAGNVTTELHSRNLPAARARLTELQSCLRTRPHPITVALCHRGAADLARVEGDLITFRAEAVALVQLARASHLAEQLGFGLLLLADATDEVQAQQNLRLEALGLAQRQGMQPLAWLAAVALAEHDSDFGFTAQALRQELDLQTLGERGFAQDDNEGRILSV